MATEHNTITDPNIHEPKGISGAATGEVYIANGSASGSFSKLPVSSINTTGATDGQLFIANGAGSRSWENSSSDVYGQMDISANGVGLATTLAADSTLNTDSDYSKITGIWQAPSTTTNSGVTFSVDKLIVPVTGTYRIELWVSFTSPNSSVTGLKFAINDTVPYSTPKMKRSSTASTDWGVASAHIMVDLTASDSLSLYYANTVTNATGIVIEDAVLMVQLIREA